MQWFELTEEERIKQIYSKFSIQEFWDWWSNKQYTTMEVRIKDYKTIVKVAQKFKIPYSASGVFVNNPTQLKKVIFDIRKTTTVWFGINPRKRNWVIGKEKTFKVLGGGDNFIDSITHILIDIDRIKKDGVATLKDFENCEILSNIILERLATEGWNKNYCKICSGHGLQLILKLDIPIKLPTQTFNDATKQYERNTEFEYLKNAIKSGFGQQLLKFIRKYKEKLGVEVDKTVFTIGRVAALPLTKNFKYDTTRWRAITDLKTGINNGLTDYILEASAPIDFIQKNIFIIKAVQPKHLIKKGKLLENPLARFLLENDFPHGQINNTLWFSLKLLLRDSKYNLQSKEFIEYYNKIKQKHNRTFTLNMPEEQFTFNENVINNYCIEYCYPPVYPLWPNRNKKVDMALQKVPFELMLNSPFIIEIPIQQETTILEDMEDFNKRLMPGVRDNNDKMTGFLHSLVKKFGRGKTEYYYTYLFEKYFNFQ